MVKKSRAALHRSLFLPNSTQERSRALCKSYKSVAGPLDASEISSGVTRKQAFFVRVTKNGQSLI
jgi:hypothetical protein